MASEPVFKVRNRSYKFDQNILQMAAIFDFKMAAAQCENFNIFPWKRILVCNIRFSSFQDFQVIPSK